MSHFLSFIGTERHYAELHAKSSSMLVIHLNELTTHTEIDLDLGDRRSGMEVEFSSKTTSVLLLCDFPSRESSGLSPVEC